MLEKLNLDSSEVEVDKDCVTVMLVDILYAFHYELRILGFSEEESSESCKNII